MKAIILLLMAVVGSYVTVLNVQHLASVKKQASGIAEVTPKVADNSGEEAAPPVDPLTSVADLTRVHGEPLRKEKAVDGTTVYYYPYYIVYVRNYMVTSCRRIAAAPDPAQTNPGPNISNSRLWGNNSNSSLNGSTTSGVGAAPATTNPGWQGHASSLGSVSLNGGAPRAATTNPGWQGGGSGVGAVSAPRTVVVRPSTGAAQYRSGGSTGSSSSQWQH